MLKKWNEGAGEEALKACLSPLMLLFSNRDAAQLKHASAGLGSKEFSRGLLQGLKSPPLACNERFLQQKGLAPGRRSSGAKSEGKQVRCIFCFARGTGRRSFGMCDFLENGGTIREGGVESAGSGGARC